MAKKGKLIKIIITSLIAVFLIICCYVGAIFWIYRPEPGKIIPATLFVSYDLGLDTYAAMKYYFLTHPLSEKWIECRKTKEVWRYLKNEKVKEIAFGSIDDYDANSPGRWSCEINEPEKIKQIMELIRSAKKGQYVSVVWMGRMKIITDKHKFIIPVESGDNAVYGLDWKSKELHKQLWEWGFGREYKYDLPSKEETMTILLYPRKYKPENPLSIFGDKKLAEEILFRVGIDKTGKSIMSYKYSRELEPKKGYYEGRIWLEKIMNAYEIALKESEKREKYYPGDIHSFNGRIIFMTQDGNYSKGIGIDLNTIYDDYIKSEQLKIYFDELGLTKELLAGKTTVDDSKDTNTGG